MRFFNTRKIPNVLLSGVSRARLSILMAPLEAVHKSFLYIYILGVPPLDMTVVPILRETWHGTT